MPRNRRFNYAEIRAAHDRLGKPGRVMAEFKCSLPTVRRALRMRDQNTTMTVSPGGTGIGTRGGTVLPPDHVAAISATALFPTQVRDAGTAVLKAGEHSSKIGGVILKGRWRGFPIFTLTFEERATCPRSCAHWLSCYGNNSPYAIRIRHGAELERRVAGEINDLAMLYRAGFAVRLHNLGDFYSVEYVKLWRQLLERHPALHAFGFSARWDTKKDPIARELVRLVLDRWDRFAIRFSDAPVDECSTVSIDHAADKPADAIICPQQQDRTESCSTCALCWSSKKRIAFIKH